MATVVNTPSLNPAERTEPVAARNEASSSIPWYLWFSVLAVTCAAVGENWDVSWHRSIGRDSFWNPAHVVIYSCAVLAAVACSYLILNTTFRRPEAMTASSVQIFGFRAPLGAFIASWGGIAMLTSAPFDNWWHNAYGLDVTIISPPHTLLLVGMYAVSVGTVVLLVSAMNQASVIGDALTARHLQWLLLYVGGLMVVFQMFYLQQFTWDVYLHGRLAYEAMAVAMPLIYTIFREGSGNRWSATITSAIYTVFMIGAILILPLFPASPKLGPVYHLVTQFIPPKFPILLVVPAICMDLLWSYTRHWKAWATGLLTGPVFVFPLVAAEWPFADFLMSKGAENRFFGSGYIDYRIPSTSFEVLRRFVDPKHGFALWAGLVLAAIFASCGAWIGILLGRWMRGIQR